MVGGRFVLTVKRGKLVGPGKKKRGESPDRE